MFREYQRFGAICVIIGLIYSGYSAFSGTGLLPHIEHYLGAERSAAKLAFILTTVVAAAVIAIPLFLVTRLFGINIRDKQIDPAADEIADMKKRS